MSGGPEKRSQTASLNLKPSYLAIKVSLLSFQVPVLAYLFFYATVTLPGPFHPISQWLAIITAAIGLAVGSRILWKLTTRSSHR